MRCCENFARPHHTTCCLELLGQVSVHQNDPYGWGFIFGSAAVVLSLMVWVLASMPESLEANAGYGSTHLYDYLLKLQNISSSDDAERGQPEVTMLRKYCHKDTTNGLWIFFGGSLAEVSYGLFLVFARPGSLYTWLTLISSTTFLGGASLMVYTSYPKNGNSAIVIEYLSTVFGSFNQDVLADFKEREPLLGAESGRAKAGTEAPRVESACPLFKVDESSDSSDGSVSGYE